MVAGRQLGDDDGTTKTSPGEHGTIDFQRKTQMDVREPRGHPPLTDAELDAWEKRAVGANEWTAEEVLRLIGEVRRLRQAQSHAVPQAEVVRDPERCGGAPTLAGTRTGVHDVVSYAHLYGGDLERVRDEALPHLSLAQVRAAMEFYANHTEEIDQVLRQRREFYERGLAEARARG
jgi:uncharacterized protein (DUF433 family)